MSHLWVLDSDFVDFRGHNCEYVSALGRACQAEGQSWSAVVHRNVAPAIQAALPCLPVLRSANGERLSRWRVLNPLLANLYTYLDLRRHVRTGVHDVVFVPNATHRQVPAIVAWCRSQRHPGRLVFLLRFTFGDPDVPSRSAELIRRSLQWVPPHWQLALLTDSLQLRAEMERRFDREVLVAPIPALPGLQADRTPGTPPTVAFPGELRDAKGFPALAEALLLLAERFRAGELRALIQSNLRPELFPRSAAALERLEAAALPGVELLGGPLSTAEYRQMLCASQLVALPYDPQNYGVQTSGVFCEAVDANCVVICSRGTWMEGELERFGLAGLTVHFDDPQSIAAALEKAADSWPELLQRSKTGRQAFLQFHRAEGLLQLVLGR